MDMFDVKRRDNPSLDKHMDPKKPPFGGPKEKKDFKGNKRKSLDKYQRVIERNRKAEGDLHDPTTGKEMNQPNYDSHWRAVTSDKVSRDAKKKPTDVMAAKQTIFTKAIEEGKIFRFEEFVAVNEEFDANGQYAQESQFDSNEAEEPIEELPIDNEENPDLGYEVDEEQLEQVMDEYGDDITEIIDKIAEEMEIEKEAVCDLLCAAVEKICKPEDEEGGENKEGEEGGDETGTEEEPAM